MSAPTVLGLNLNQVEKIVAFWQGQLRLNDWRITVEIGDPREMPENGAEVETTGHTREALIRIAADCPDMLCLHEFVIHELLHLFFYWVKQPSTEYELEEQAIHAIAPIIAGLYSLSRAKVAKNKKSIRVKFKK